MIRRYPITTSLYGIGIPTWLGLALVGTWAAVLACLVATLVGWLWVS